MVIKIHETAPMVLSILDDALPHLFPNIRDMFTRDKVKNILFDGVLLSCQDEEVGKDKSLTINFILSLFIYVFKM